MILNNLETSIIKELISIVQAELKDAEGGHDWFHIERVLKTSEMIAKIEKANIFVVQLAALLHDIADAKFHGGDETIGPLKAREILKKLHIDTQVIDNVVQIIENISFKGGNKHSEYVSLELDVVRDADRLDAMGAIGIARAFNYGGFKNRKLYDPEIMPKLQMDKEEYKKNDGPTINHFYEKLLLLKDLMTTKSGKEMALERHQFLLSYLRQFNKEVSI
ncbi:MAG: HD domain-containing protein [Saprospiraceae bacterium]|nr:HD domain-containing protein [Saprospiraceae bacterium]